MLYGSLRLALYHYKSVFKVGIVSLQIGQIELEEEEEEEEFHNVNC